MNLSSKATFKDDYENSNNSSTSCRQILKCGEVGQALLFNGARIGTSVPAATIILDTSKFCNPCIIFEFTSNIIGTLFQGTLNFQLYRSCNNQIPIPIGPQFSFTQSIPAVFANMFTFLYVIVIHVLMNAAHIVLLFQLVDLLLLLVMLAFSQQG